MQLNLESEEFLRLFPAHAGKGRRKKPAHPRPKQNDQLPFMKLSQTAYQAIMRDIGAHPPERGGILLGPVGEMSATHFIFDETGKGTGASWTFGHLRINEILKQYVPLGLDMRGFIHSHPSGYRTLSSQDLTDFSKPFHNPKNEDLQEVWAPIVVDGSIYPFIIFRDRPNQAEPAQIVLI